MTQIRDGNPVTKRRSRAMVGIVSIGAVTLLYFLTLAILPRDGFWINDNGCKFIQTRSLIETDYRDFSIPWPGRDVDPEFTCNPLPSPFGHLVGDRLFGTFSPVFALLSSVSFHWSGYAGLYFLSWMGGLLTLAGVWSITGLLPMPDRARRIAQPLGVGIVGLATPIWFYSVTFWEHMPAVACVTWTVMSCLTARQRHPMRNLFIAGCLAAGAVYFRDDCYVLALVVPFTTISFGPGWLKRVVTFGAAFGLVALPLWLFQWVALGEPFGFHLQASSALEVGFWNHLLDRDDVVALLLFNNHPSVWLSGFVSLFPLVLLVWRPRLRPATFCIGVIVLYVIAIVNCAIVLGGLVFSHSPIWSLAGANGFFAAAPILMIGLLGSGRSHRAISSEVSKRLESDRRTVLAKLILVYVLAYVLLTPKAHAGGIHWGCRYLLPLMPLMGVLTASTIAGWWVRFQTRHRCGAALMCTALAFSLIAQLFSLTLLHGRKSYSSKLNRIVRAAPEKVVIAEGWFVPQSLAGCFFEKQIFLAGRPEATEAVIRRLRERGVDRVLSVAWAPRPSQDDAPALLVEDGWLNFMTLRIESVNIGELGNK